MKRAGICLWMMIKRMGKHPAYWVLLLLFPAAVYAVPRLNEAMKSEGILVGYVMEETGEEPEAARIKGMEGIREEAARIKGAEDIQEEAARIKGMEDIREEAARINGMEDIQVEAAIEEEKRSDGEGAGDVEDGRYGYSDKLLAGVEYKLAEGGLFQYIKYTETEEMEEDILTGKLSCGVVFDEDFAEKLRAQDYYHCIALYLPEGMNVGGMVQEDLFQRVYQAYSAVWYAELLSQQGHQMEPEEVLLKFSEYQAEGKVFAVDYEVLSEKEEELYGNSESGMEASAVSLRGILAFLTLLSASLGALNGSRDRKRNLGKGISCSGRLTAAAAGAPILPATLFLAGGMMFVDVKMTYMSGVGVQGEGLTTGSAEKLTGMAGIVSDGLMQAQILPEVTSALLYGIVLWMFAMVAGRFLPEKLMAQTMPCFLLLILLCCPVFLDLGETIPMIGYLSKLFPITWYMNFWG